jgi:hypothetical protein
MVHLDLSLTWDLSSQRFTISFNCLKDLVDELGHTIWQAIFTGNGSVQESRRRNRNTLNSTSHLRWQPEYFKYSRRVKYSLIETIIFLTEGRYKNGSYVFEIY